MSALDEILSLTTQVESCLDEGDWIGAAALNARRQELLTGMFAGRDPQALDPETRDVLRELLARNEAAAARVRLDREQVATRQQRIERSAAALLVYAQTAGGAA